ETVELMEKIRAVQALAAVSEQASEQVKAAKSTLLEKLKAQQARLVRLHIEEGDAVSPDAFRDERQRLQGEIAAVEKSLAAAETTLKLDTSVLCMALELIQDIGSVYANSPGSLRRSFNQAFFSRLKLSATEEDESRE